LLSLTIRAFAPDEIALCAGWHHVQESSMNRESIAKQLALTLSTVCVLGLAITDNAYGQPTIGGCPVLPANNIWNTPVDTLPVLPNSASMTATIGASTGFHADFGAGTWAGGPIGIPFITVPGTQTKYPATFYYASESDRGPYAIPLNAPIEGGSASTGDRHAIAVDTTNCILYELYNAFPQSSSWSADAGAIFDLRSNALRPATWTSTDAAGLPIMPGLVTYDEVLRGEITHAVRFTAPRTRHEFVWPARHYASSLTGSQYPRMGERFRLKASFDVSTFPADVQVILRAMKKYGIMLADNGSAWYISGQPDDRWNNDNLHTLGRLLGSNFEAVDAAVLRIDPDSGAAIQNGVAVSVSPQSAVVRTGRLQTFTAAVTGAPNTVTWSVNGITGGDTVVGSIDANGQYYAPSTVPSPPAVTVRAASAAFPASTGSASVAILPLPSISSVTPSPVATGSFKLTINGVGFSAGSVVFFDGAALATSVVSSTQLTATGNAPAARPSVPVVVTTPDGEVSAAVFVDVVSPPPPVAITISPTTAAVRVSRTVQFTASVANSSNRSVIWKVNGVTGGNSAVGTISSSGFYRAPSSVPSPAIVTIKAVAAADQSKTASASVTITRR